MKTLILCILSLINLPIFGQIIHEHTYPGEARRIFLEIDGEKYYYLDHENFVIHLFNADHSFWKSIELDVPAESHVDINHISQTQIRPDALIEVIYNFFTSETPTVSRLINENNDLLLSLEGFLAFNTVPCLSNKLIGFNIFNPNVFFKVYSLPQITLEHTYPQIIARVNLSYSGEKYIFPKTENGRIIFVLNNSDHSYWKTLIPPVPEDSTFVSLTYLHQTEIDTDAVLEYAYHYSKGDSLIGIRLISENNETFLSVPDESSVYASEIENLPTKLITNPDYMIYSIPGLVLENVYEEPVSRANLSISGEKYYTPEPDSIFKVFNADHTLWKTTNIISPGDTLIYFDILDISETLFNSDPGLEFLYSARFYGRYEVGVMNENGNAIFTRPHKEIRIDETANLPAKLILTYDVFDAPDSTQIFSIPFQRNLQKNTGEYLIYPNPTHGPIHMDFPSSTYDYLSIIDISGKLVVEIPKTNCNCIDVSFLSSGAYILIGQKNGEVIFANKFVVQVNQ